jgi:hypothetical protein
MSAYLLGISMNICRAEIKIMDFLKDLTSLRLQAEQVFGKWADENTAIEQTMEAVRLAMRTELHEDLYASA